MLNVRLGRSDVDDPVVATLPEIGMGLEGAAMWAGTICRPRGSRIGFGLG